MFFPDVFLGFPVLLYLVVFSWSLCCVIVMSFSFLFPFLSFFSVVIKKSLTQNLCNACFYVCFSGRKVSRRHCICINERIWNLVTRFFLFIYKLGARAYCTRITLFFSFFSLHNVLQVWWTFFPEVSTCYLKHIFLPRKLLNSVFQELIKSEFSFSFFLSN